MKQPRWAFPRYRSIAAAACVALLASAAGTAQANGRYPAAGLIAFDPSDPARILVRATYGLLITNDGGESWYWVCEQAVGFSDNEDPMVAFTADGSILAGTFKGLSMSKDQGCDWTMAGGGLVDRYAVDLSTEKGNPKNAVALVSNGIGGGQFNTQVWETTDNGASWTQLGANLDVEFLGLTVDAAPSDPARLYATGRLGAPDYTGLMQRSLDRGKTWEGLPIAGADDKHIPYLSAVDPADPATLYVRLDGAEEDSLVVSKDSGETWETVFEGQAGLFGFALSPDGAKVAVGGDKDGLWMADAATLTFSKVANLTVRCLTWTGEGLFACADEFKDGFEVGVSADDGKTFTPIKHLREVCPLVCDPSTEVGEACGIRWGALAATIEAECGPSGAGGGGGTGGGGTGGEGASGAAASGKSGCACGIADGAPSGDGAHSGRGALALAVAAAARSLRRRRRLHCDNQSTTTRQR